MAELVNSRQQRSANALRTMPIIHHQIFHDRKGLGTVHDVGTQIH